ncbi:MAG: outer membrane beta-barrel protein [Rhodanobacteraceae bacterium]
MGLNGHFNPTDKWYISARAGFFRWTVDGRADLTDTTGATTHISGSEHGLNGYAGVGTGVGFNRNWSLGVNFDYCKINKHRVNVDTKLYSVTAEYRF